MESVFSIYSIICFISGIFLMSFGVIIINSSFAVDIKCKYIKAS